MALYKKAQRHTMWNQPPRNNYGFADKHRHLWRTFWEEMGGDEQKLLKFAESAKITDPKGWFEALHRFLFDFFSSNQQFSKSAAKVKSFKDYLLTTVEHHTKAPRQKDWYTAKGITPTSFIRTLEWAAEIDDQEKAVSYINARMPDMGELMYSEFVLMQTPQKEKIKSIASHMNKRAYELEKAAGVDILTNVEAGSEVRHSLFPEEELVVQGFLGDEIIVENSKGNICRILDPWNLTVL